LERADKPLPAVECQPFSIGGGTLKGLKGIFDITGMRTTQGCSTPRVLISVPLKAEVHFSNKRDRKVKSAVFFSYISGRVEPTTSANLTKEPSCDRLQTLKANEKKQKQKRSKFRKLEGSLGLE